MTDKQEKIVRDWYDLYFNNSTKTRVELLIRKLKDSDARSDKPTD